MAKEKYYRINGIDEYGNDENVYIRVHKNKEDGKIHIFSSEECSDVILKPKQARELIDAIKKCILNEGLYSDKKKENSHMAEYIS